MKSKFVDCFMLMGTALSLRGDQGLPSMGRPILQDVFTTNVNVSITLSDVSVKSVQNMELEFTFHLHQRWLDPRLNANQQTKKLAVNGQIWRPWLTLTEGEIRIKDMTQFWRGFGTEGNILYSEVVILRTVCTRNFKKYPFDVQKCFIKLGSYRFPLEEVQLFWDIKPTEILIKTNYLIQFELLDEVVTYEEIEPRPSGNFSVLVAEFTLQRNYLHHIFCLYLPCLLIISLTYLTFWFKAKLLKIRYSISSINSGLLLYYYNNSMCSLHTSYMKASDIFVSICFVFITIGFFVNLIIDVFFRLNADNNKHHFVDNSGAKYNKRYKYLDYCMRVVYPIIFMCINYFYVLIFVY